MQDLRGQTDRGSGVALRRLGQDLALGDLGKLAGDLVPQMPVGEDPDSLGRQNGTQPVDGLLDQGTIAEQAKHLLGGGPAALGPEPGAPASGQNQTVDMFHDVTGRGIRGPASIRGPSGS